MHKRYSFGIRFGEALGRTGLTQVQFASALSARNCPTSSGAVSQWISGLKRPEREKVSLIAELLSVDPDWLETGALSKAPLNFTALRDQYRQEAEWIFRRAPEDGGRDFGNANIWSFQPSLRTLVREALQNINDEILDADEGAEVVFRLVRLSGSDLETFLDSICWQSSLRPGAGLQNHLEASASEHTKLGRILRDGLSALALNRELILLVIEDSRTQGLTGPEVGNGNFAALVRNNLDTHKHRETSGGSYGLGKAVFWLCSRYSTVLFHSCPVVSDTSVNAQTGRSRVIGKTDLSWHHTENTDWAGPGWFGVRNADSPRADSVWNNRALVQDLYLARESEASGTSICIVGFHDPSGEVLNDIQQMGDRIAREAARNFWPGIASGRLAVRVVLCDGREERARFAVEPEHYHSAFVDAYLRREATASTLTGSGDILTAQIPLRTPSRKTEGGRLCRVEPHEALLIVRLATEQESHDELAGHLALFRGSEMVVQYRPIRLQSLSGTPGFHAVLVCGTAAGSTAADQEAELFLRAAEPPAHDRWELTSELPARYARGGAKAISDMLNDAARIIKEMLVTEHTLSEEGPQSIRDLLRIPYGKPVLGGNGWAEGTTQPLSGTPALRLPRIESVSGHIDARGRWEIRGEVRVPDSRLWRVTPVLLFDGEGGAIVRVPWETLEAGDGCRCEGTTLVISAQRRKAHFRAISDVTCHPAPAAEAAILVELRDAHVVESNDTLLHVFPLGVSV